MTILLTGGAGYIGSHVAVELVENGFDVVIFDNFSNSSPLTVKKIEQIIQKPIRLYEGDALNYKSLEDVFRNERIDGVIHLAGLKSVPDSTKDPLNYYNNNLIATLNLLNIMDTYGVKNLIFSSSATVYGEAEQLPITEESPRQKATNPYGQTKIMIEEILEDIYKTDSSWNIVFLRYFNPIGAHSSGLIGDNPANPSTSLIPLIAKAALGQTDLFYIYGDDYETIDGTGIRDYIHITDLAKGHTSALKKFGESGGLSIYNLGTGRGSSVFEVLRTFEETVGHRIPYKVKKRRPGDIAISYCDVSKAKNELGWSAKKSLKDMCVDSWKWYKMNPNGYGARDGT